MNITITMRVETIQDLMDAMSFRHRSSCIPVGEVAAAIARLMGEFNPRRAADCWERAMFAALAFSPTDDLFDFAAELAQEIWDEIGGEGECPLR